LAVVAAVAFVYSAWNVWEFVRQYRLGEIVDWLAAVPPSKVAFSVLFAAASYATLTGYDYIAVRYAGSQLPYRQVALASFVSLGVGYPLGPAPLGTGVLRYFYYTRLGVGLEAFTKLALLIMATAILGKFSFAALVLLHDASTAARWSGLGEPTIRMFAVLSLVGVVGYVAAAALWRRAVQIGSWRFASPGLTVALIQVVLGTVNYFCITACLHQMMAASAPISYPVVATAYVFANFAVLLTHVPGGWGVMEYVIISVVPQLDTIGALVAFRTIYFLVPFAIGLCVLLAMEGRRSLAAIATARKAAP
jgi:uncharacterized membrane protein YbhN (UPF0104 family)